MRNTVAHVRWENVVKTFDGVHALDRVSLEIGSATVLAVVGGNGSGKSTLFNVVTGIVKCDQGACFIGDNDVSRWTPAPIARLGVARTFQQVRLAGLMTLVDNVLAAAEARQPIRLISTLLASRRARDDRRACALQYLAEVDLADRSNDLAGELSFGQQKLLSLACIRAADAEVILLDEPFAGIEHQMIDRIVTRLQAWRDGGRIVAFIEHDVRRAREAATCIVRMANGRIEAMELF